MLTSPAEIIDALGGTKKVAEMLGVGASAISNYRRDGFPAAKHYALAKACEASGLAIDDRVFGGPPAAAPRHFRYDGANKSPVTSPDGFLKDLVAAGYRQVETPILQPSDPFINRMGAEMQRRLYRFTDPGGEELCLRPDLTIPSVLDYVRAGRFDEARLCYQGTAFRYQPRGAGKPEEFTQMGLEIINGKTGDAAIEDDIEVLEKLLKIIRAAGVTGYKIHFVLARARKISQPKAIIPPERLARIIPPDPDAMIAGRSGEDIIRRIERSRRYHAQRAEQQNEEDPPDDSHCNGLDGDRGRAVASLTYKRTTLKPLVKAEALTITPGSALKFMCRNSAPAKSSRRAGVMTTLLKALVRRIKFPLLAALSRLNACAKRRAR